MLHPSASGRAAARNESEPDRIARCNAAMIRRLTTRQPDGKTSRWSWSDGATSEEISARGRLFAAQPVAVGVDLFCSSRWRRRQAQIDDRDGLSHASAAADGDDLLPLC